MPAYIKPCGASCQIGGSPCEGLEYYRRGQAPYDETFELQAGSYVFSGYDTYGDGWAGPGGHGGDTATMTDEDGAEIFEFEPACQNPAGGCPIGDAFGIGSPPPTGDNNGQVFFSVSPTQNVRLVLTEIGPFPEEISWDIAST